MATSKAMKDRQSSDATTPYGEVWKMIVSPFGWEPLFADGPDLDFELVESRTFDGRTQLLKYVSALH